jgi:hypothetical protein
MVVVGVVAAAAFFMLVLYWWSEGIFATSDAVLLDVVFCTLIFGLFAAKEPWHFAGAFVPLAAAGAYAIYSYRIGGMRGYLKSQCGVFMQAIQSDPRNLAARERFAETLHQLGDLDRAVSEMQAAVDLGAGIECQYQLNQWQRELRARYSIAPVCKWCGTDSPVGTKVCPRCGTDLPRRSALAVWLTGGKWAAARLWLLIIVGVALVSMSLVLLPVHFALIPIALLGIALGGWSLIGSTQS